MKYFGKTKKIHFVGIGGAGMSGIAEYLHHQGFEITGSDISSTATTAHLQEIGITVFNNHHPSNIQYPDVVVKSSAVTNENIEIQAAENMLIPVIRRAEILAELMRMSYGIAIAGTHGKTTTTSMVGLVMMAGKLDPTVIVGGKVMNLGTNNILGGGEQMIVEADEFDRSFLTLSPIIAGITNIEADHLDCYKDLDAIKDAFIEYANKVPFFGSVVTCMDDKGARSIIPYINKRIITYGLAEYCDFRAVNLRSVTDNDKPGIAYTVLHNEKKLGDVRLQLYGQHNVLNSLMAVAIAHEFAVPFTTVADALASFAGVFRRCEYKGKVNNLLFYDDYAHHPTEIIATLKGLKEVTDRRIVALFQPHLYTRTKLFAHEFGASFSDADMLIVTPIFPAREKPITGVSGKIIADIAVETGHQNVHYIASNEAITAETISLLRQDDLLITIGAGDIYKYGENIMEKIKTD